MCTLIFHYLYCFLLVICVRMIILCFSFGVCEDSSLPKKECAINSQKKKNKEMMKGQINNIISGRKMPQSIKWVISLNQ